MFEWNGREEKGWWADREKNRIITIFVLPFHFEWWIECPHLPPCAIRPPTKRANLIFLFLVKFQCPDGDFFHLKKSVEILMIWSLPVSNEPLLMTNGLFIFCVKIKMPGWSALQWHMNEPNLSRELLSMQGQTKRMNYFDCILWSIFGATDIHSFIAN